MTTAKRVQGTAISIPAGVTLGVSVSLAITCALAAVSAWLVLKGKIGDHILGYTLMLILLISTVSGTLLAANKTKRRRMMVCCITGGTYYLLLLAITAVFFGSNYQGAGVTALLILAGSMASAMLGLKKCSKKERRYKKYHNC